MSYRNLELIEQITNLVVQAIEPHRMLDQILSIAISLARAERGAIFSFPEGKEMQLLCSRGADQSMIVAARSIYEMIHSGKFYAGEIIYCPDVLIDSRFGGEARAKFGGIRTFACIPILTKEGETERTSGILYVDSLSTSNLCSADDLEILKKFTRLIDRAIKDCEQLRTITISSSGISPRSPAAERLALSAYQERQRVEAKIKEYLLNKSIEDIERAKLMLLMEKTQGNISKVAQEMGMQRRTIYLKLKKYGIERSRGKDDAATWEPAYE
jgi:transcriptional regulator with GAF, ATPase, and Fis domain